MEVITEFSMWLRGYISMFSVAIVACLLVIFDGFIRNMVKQFVKNMHFVVRVSVFVVLFTIGYTAIAATLTPMVAQGLAGLSSIYLPAVILAVFIFLGILLERR